MIDVTSGPLTPSLIRLAVPSVMQAILSNCYSFNDYLFVGHIKDPDESSAATAAMAATVGLQVGFTTKFFYFYHTTHDI